MDVNLWPVVQDALQAIVAIVVPAALAAAVAYVRRYVNANVSVKRQEQFREIVRVNVLAAEQLGLVAEAKKQLFDKRQYAIQTSERWLEAQGIHVDLDVIAAQVESLVLENFNLPKALPSPVVGKALSR